MKKVLALALGMLLIPFTAFGMQTMDEAAMDSVTGQSGVAISVDNIGIYSTGETTWYQGGEGNAWFGITAGDEITRIDFMANPLDMDPETGEMGIGTFASDATYGYGDPSALMIQTSDQAIFVEDPEGEDDTTIPGVKITLGTLKIRTFAGDEATEFGVGMSDDGETNVPGEFAGSENGDWTYGRISSTDGETRVLGGSIAIVPAQAYLDGGDEDAELVD